MKIKIKRSEEWVAQQRLARGVNVPDTITVEIDPAELSLEARRVLLRPCGKYPQEWSGAYGQHYRWMPPNKSIWADGVLPPVIDSDEPTPEQIGAAIVEADRQLSEKRAEEERMQAEREAEKQARQAAIKQAEELLADRLAELEACKDARDTLARFLRHVPEDAKRGTLKRLTAEALPEQIDELRKRVEDASPNFFIFGDEDEADSDSY